LTSFLNIYECHTHAPWVAVFSSLGHAGAKGIGRAFYCFVVGQRVVILHAFMKKTQQTPEQEFRIAGKG